VAGRIGDDELALVGREEAVGDVDGDALLALGLQAVDQQREVDVVADVPFSWSRASSVGELVLEDQLGVVEQPADQRRLAVVDGAAGEEAQQRLLGLLRRVRDTIEIGVAGARQLAETFVAIRNSPRASSSPSSRPRPVDQRPSRSEVRAVSISLTMMIEGSVWASDFRWRRSADSSRGCGSAPSDLLGLRRLEQSACGRRRP
jgi:hypothetical protein